MPGRLPPLVRGRGIWRLGHLVPGFRAGRVHDASDVAATGEHIPDVATHQPGGGPGSRTTARVVREDGHAGPAAQGWPRHAGSANAGRPAQCAGGGKDAVVTCTLHMAWDDRLTRYDFGPGHPLAPIRVELTVELARDFGVLATPGVSVAAPEPAGLPELELVHDAGYIGIVQQVSAEPSAIDFATLFRSALDRLWSERDFLLARQA